MDTSMGAYVALNAAAIGLVFYLLYNMNSKVSSNLEWLKDAVDAIREQQQNAAASVDPGLAQQQVAPWLRAAAGVLDPNSLIQEQLLPFGGDDTPASQAQVAPPAQQRAPPPPKGGVLDINADGVKRMDRGSDVCFCVPRERLRALGGAADAAGAGSGEAFVSPGGDVTAAASGSGGVVQLSLNTDDARSIYEALEEVHLSDYAIEPFCGHETCEYAPV
jgi:hypothetical protein